MAFHAGDYCIPASDRNPVQGVSGRGIPCSAAGCLCASVHPHVGLRNSPQDDEENGLRGGADCLLPVDSESGGYSIGISLFGYEAVNMHTAGSSAFLRHVLVPPGSFKGKEIHLHSPGHKRCSADYQYHHGYCGKRFPELDTYRRFLTSAI